MIFCNYMKTLYIYIRLFQEKYRLTKRILFTYSTKIKLNNNDNINSQPEKIDSKMFKVDGELNLKQKNNNINFKFYD